MTPNTAPLNTAPRNEDELWVARQVHRLKTAAGIRGLILEVTFYPRQRAWRLELPPKDDGK